jgi:type IV pilus assembly protein PilC
MSLDSTRLVNGDSARPPRTSARDVTAFTRQLTSLLNAGLPLVQALDLIARPARRGAISRVARGLARRISAGQSFASALAAYPAQFDRLYRELAAIGEVSGTLALVLARVVEHRERAAAQRRKLRAALAYPCAVLLLSIAVGAALLAFVVPTFQHVFESFGATLPGPTRAVIALSSVLLRSGPPTLAACGALWLIARRVIRHVPHARTALDRAVLSIPWAGALVRAVAAARWARALGTLLTAGIPLADALHALSHVTGNVIFDAANTQIERRLRRGERLAHAMHAVGCFPAALVEPIAVAEESSALDAMLLDCATLAEREVEDKLALATACAEPLVVTVLGLAVGGLVIALYLPIIELGNVV